MCSISRLKAWHRPLLSRCQPNTTHSSGSQWGSRYAGLVTVLISGLELVVGYAIVNSALRAGVSLAPLLG
jgi:hypothetical protein